MLRMFGDPEFLALKQRVVAAVTAGEDPSVIDVTCHRFARTNVRVALRQLKVTHDGTPSLAAWMAVHERNRHLDGDEDATSIITRGVSLRSQGQGIGLAMRPGTSRSVTRLRRSAKRTL